MQGRHDFDTTAATHDNLVKAEGRQGNLNRLGLTNADGITILETNCKMTILYLHTDTLQCLFVCLYDSRLNRSFRILYLNGALDFQRMERRILNRTTFQRARFNLPYCTGIRKHYRTNSSYDNKNTIKLYHDEMI